MDMTQRVATLALADRPLLGDCLCRRRYEVGQSAQMRRRKRALVADGLAAPAEQGLITNAKAALACVRVCPASRRRRRSFGAGERAGNDRGQASDITELDRIAR